MAPFNLPLVYFLPPFMRAKHWNRPFFFFERGKWRYLFTQKRLWCWEGLGAEGEGDNRGWDGWMASLTRWTWVWVNSGSWWWTGGSQRVGHDWATELNWTDVNFTSVSSVAQLCPTLWDPINRSMPGFPVLSSTPGVYPNSCPLSRWYHPTIWSSVVPLSSCPQSFPASGSFHRTKKKKIYLTEKKIVWIKNREEFHKLQASTEFLNRI